MKKIIFILALFASFVANSQYTPPPGYTNINSRYDWLAGVFRALGLPAGGNAAFTAGQAQRAGSVYYDSTGVDAGLYIWDGSAWVGVQYTDADARAAISLTTTGTLGVLTYNSSTGVFSYGGPPTFVGLTDGPGAFAGQTGKSVRVNAGETALEYFTPSSVPALTQYRLAVGDASNLLSSNVAITASRLLGSDANGVPVALTPTVTEANHLSGVTSAIQTQLNTKAADALVVHIAGTETVTGAKTFSALLTAANIVVNTTADSGSPDGAVRIVRTLDGLSSNGHGYRDQTSFRNGGFSYAAFSADATLSSGTSENFGHIIGFQSVVGNSTDGTADEVIGFGDYGFVGFGAATSLIGYVSNPSISATKTAVNRFGIRILDVAGSGTLSAGNYGIYINNLTRGTGSNYAMYVEGNNPIFTAGKIGVGITPTAMLHLKAGTAPASTAPLKFTSGTLLTTAEAGAMEFLTDKFYGTITTGAARKEITLNDIALTSGRIPFITTNGRLTDVSTILYDGTTATFPLLKITGGSPGANKVLTSDADGDATWTTATIAPKNQVIENPTSSENMFFFRTDVAITITSVTAVLVGSGSPSVTYQINFGTDRTSGTNVYTAGQTVTSTTTGTAASGVNDATIPAGSWVWTTTSAATDVTQLNLSITYTKD